MSETFRTRVRDVRRLKGWSQRRLSAALDDIGVKMDAATVTRIEGGQRGVTLEDVIAFAAALGVSPLHLIVPLENDATLDLAPGLSISAEDARAWLRGQRPLPGDDGRFFYVVTPELDWDVVLPGSGGRFESREDYEKFRAHWEREILRRLVTDAGGTYRTTDGEDS